MFTEIKNFKFVKTKGTRTWRVKTTKEANKSGAHEASVIAAGRILSNAVGLKSFQMFYETETDQKSQQSCTEY